MEKQSDTNKANSILQYMINTEIHFDISKLTFEHEEASLFNKLFSVFDVNIDEQWISLGNSPIKCTALKAYMDFINGKTEEIQLLYPLDNDLISGNNLSVCSQYTWNISSVYNHVYGYDDRYDALTFTGTSTVTNNIGMLDYDLQLHKNTNSSTDGIRIRWWDSSNQTTNNYQSRTPIVGLLSCSKHRIENRSLNRDLYEYYHASLVKNFGEIYLSTSLINVIDSDKREMLSNMLRVEIGRIMDILNSFVVKTPKFIMDEYTATSIHTAITAKNASTSKPETDEAVKAPVRSKIYITK